MSAEDTIVSGVAGRYATALFELAEDAGAIDRIAGELDQLDGMIAESEDLTRLLRSPVFSAEEQERAMGAILEKAGITGVTENFVRLVAKNRRLFALPGMIEGYRVLVARHRGEVSAHVTSAHELSDEEVKDLTAALTSSLGKEVQLDRKVDASLLGGLIVRVGSRMIDTSLRTKLNSLKIAMKEVG
ncbi:F0F1 ATP synthase subunit delta [Microbaculum marinum]|uniref:ATP synthase subunit delta n=1 Tax=Microbaculum marinum TaxID=1764581 RepID=A0AAW9RNI2_9HYPH